MAVPLVAVAFRFIEQKFGGLLANIFLFAA
jgi:hypothetical protein